jgi:hypothetical protein
MLKEVKQYGLEKFAGNEELADEFVKGFVAQVAMEKAAAGGFKGGSENYGHDFAKSLVEGLGRGVGSFGVNAGVWAGVAGLKFVNDMSMHTRFLKALDQAIRMSPDFLQKQPLPKIQRYADTIYKFAPMVATDPNLLQSVLTNAVHGDGVDITTIKSLTDLEGRWKDNGSIAPKTYV